MILFIFAAGIGSRLKPWTDNHPKALARLGEKTLLNKVIESVCRYIEPEKIGINIHHFGEQIREHIANDAFLASKNIAISDESEKLLDTGGGLLKAFGDHDESVTILAHNADIITDLDYSTLLSHHVTSGNDITLLTMKRDTSRKLLFSADKLLKGWRNTVTGETKPADRTPDTISKCEELAFGGIQVISGSAIKFLKEYAKTIGKDVFSSIDFYLWAKDYLRIGAYEPTEDFRWIDVGKPENLEKANIMFEIEK